MANINDVESGKKTISSGPGKTGKAKAHHDPKRPESRAVIAALEADDIEALERALTPRQLAFCREYVVDFNGSAAAIRAGYAPAHSDKQAYLLLKNRGIRKYIEFLSTSKAAAIVSVNPDYIIQQITGVIHKPGAKDTDVLRALDMLARHLGMYVDRTEISGKDGEAIRVEQEVRQQKIQEEAASLVNQLRQMAAKREVLVIDESDG